MKKTIQNLHFENIKGTSRTLTLKPLTILTGRNHAGKTAVLNAITLALHGHIPALGKTNPATMSLASADCMTVSASGEKWATVRTWKRTAKTVKAAASSTGEPPEFAAAALDPDLFTGATPKARLEMLAGLVEGDAIATLERQCTAWRRQLNAPATAPDPVALAAMLEDIAKNKVSEARERARRYTGTIQGFAELGDDTTDYAGDYAAAQQARDAAIKAQASAIAKAAELERADEAAADAAETLANLPAVELIDPTEAEADKEATRNAFLAANTALRKAEAERDRMLGLQRALIGAIKNEDNRSIDGLINEITADIAQIQSLNVEPPEAYEPQITALRQMMDDLSVTIAASRRAAAEADKHLAEMAQLQCCPVCLAAAPDWKQAATAHYQKITTEAKATEAAAIKDLQIDTRQRDRILLKLQESNAAKRRKDELHGLIARRDAAIEYAKLTTPVAEAIAKLDQARAEMDQASDADNRAVARHRAAMAQQGELAQRLKLKEAIDNRPLASNLTEAYDHAEECQRAAETITAQLEAIRQKQHAVSEAAGQRKVRDQAKEELAKAEKEAEEFAALAAEIRTFRTEAVESAYRPIIEAAAEFGEGVMGGRLTVEDGDIGLARGAAFYPYEVMSGTERLITTASIQAALSAANGGLVMLDELSRVDRQYRQRFVANLAWAIKTGRISQAILIDHDAETWDDSLRVDIA